MRARSAPVIRVVGSVHCTGSGGFVSSGLFDEHCAVGMVWIPAFAGMTVFAGMAACLTADTFCQRGAAGTTRFSAIAGSVAADL
jgi:hypothetical protein